MKKFLVVSILFYGILLVAVWLLPVGFSACEVGSLWCLTAYWITESAGREGSVVIVVLTALILTFRAPSLKNKLKIFFAFSVSVFMILGVLAVVNERMIKPVLKFHRPSHTYMITETKSNVLLDSLYSLESQERRDFFRKLVDTDTLAFKKIHPLILSHWVYEAGYSFPSGHSFNAFMLATILGFAFYKLGRGPWRNLFFLPFAWAVFVAVSRVSVGAHTPLDVSGGALIGLVMANALLAVPAIQKFMFQSETITLE
jgi:phosphatidylglycerophosphatase B